MDHNAPLSLSGQVTCLTCNAPASTNQRFCIQCGAALIQTCASCGAESPLNYRFCGQCGEPLSQASSRETTTKSDNNPLREERRWATVLFVDVSGFTAMSEQMDPEDVKVMADGWSKRLSAEIRRFGGTVINIVGDEVVAVFGAPVAHEDDPERAVRAALAMAQLNLSDDPSRVIQVHVGINTGQVMAGLMGPRERRDYNVMGDTVNTAARLLSAASRGTVYVGEETFKATRHAVTYAERIPIKAKGKDQPIPVWEALNIVAIPQARQLGSAPLIGRDEELTQLTKMWERVVNNSQPHLVTLLGEAGIGKSRLTAEFEQQLPGEARILHGRCLPYGEALSYGAMSSMLKEAASVVADDDAKTARAKLGMLIEQVVGTVETADVAQITQHLALFGGLDIETDRVASAGDHRTLLSSMRQFLHSLAYQTPTCLIFDDIHWADDTLLDLIEHIAARIQDVPLMVVTQARPALMEKRDTWGRGVASFTSLPLPLLNSESERELVEALCLEHGLSPEKAAHIGRDAGGNPLFVEELVAMVAEQAESATIPSAIKLLLSARLDALSPSERQALQLASVFGLTFWEGGLRALVSPDVTSSLERLMHKGLVRMHPQSQYPGEGEYAFKHDLIRDVAYEILPKAERRILHGQVADWFEETAGEQIEAYFDVIAHHAVEAGQLERAITYLDKAAKRAGDARAHRQESALLAKAISLSKQLGKIKLVGHLRVRNGQAIMKMGRWADAEHELTLALDELDPQDIEQRVQGLCDLAFTRFWLVNVSEQVKAAEEAIALAEHSHRDELIGQALFALAYARWNDGNIKKALELCQRALQTADTPENSFAAAVSALIFQWYGDFNSSHRFARKGIQMARSLNDTGVLAVTLPHLGLSLATSGHYDEAQSAFEEAIQFGREHEMWPFLARSISMSAGYHLDLCDYEGNEEIAQEAVDLAKSINFPPPLISSKIDLLLNFVRRRDLERSEKLMAEIAPIIENAPGFHGWLWRCRLPVGQAELALAHSEWEQAVHWAELAVERCREFGRPKYEALALAARANARHAMKDTAKAMDDFTQALDMIRKIGDPAIFLLLAASRLAVEVDDTLLAEAKETSQRILANLSDETMRRRFMAAKPVQLLNRL